MTEHRPSDTQYYSRNGNGTTKWLANLVPFIGLLFAGIAFGISQEHRITIIEESLKAQQQIMMRQELSLEALRSQIDTNRNLINHLEDIEEFFHGRTDSSENAAIRRIERKRAEERR